jgi:K+-transporting ATPase KdpF subunit
MNGLYLWCAVMALGLLAYLFWALIFAEDL